MWLQLEVSTITHAIQLAVAPVFLLTGVGAILNVLTSRLSRIIDRSRVLQGRRATVAGEERAEVEAELALMEQRARLIHWAIALCTASTLLVCADIAVVFLGALVSMRVAAIVALLFIAAMLCLIVALVYFLREIHLAIYRMKIKE